MRPLTPQEKGSVLRRLRRQLGLGQGKLARAARVGRTDLVHWESANSPRSGETRPRSYGLVVARRLARALGVDVTELMFDFDEPVGVGDLVVRKQPSVVAVLLVEEVHTLSTDPGGPLFARCASAGVDVGWVPVSDLRRATLADVRDWMRFVTR